MEELRTAAEQGRPLAPGPHPALTEVLLVGGATRMPGFRRFVKNMTGMEPERSAVHPDLVGRSWGLGSRWNGAWAPAVTVSRGPARGLARARSSDRMASHALPQPTPIAAIHPSPLFAPEHSPGCGAGRRHLRGAARWHHQGHLLSRRLAGCNDQGLGSRPGIGGVNRPLCRPWAAGPADPEAARACQPLKL